MDDVDIGYTLGKLGITLMLGRRTTVSSHYTYSYDKDRYHYRCKLVDRSKEAEIMLKILKQINS
jgi:hypothetical protein